MSDSDKEIFCYFYEKGELQINPDGQVFPCCFIANSMFVSKTFDYPKPLLIRPRNTCSGLHFCSVFGDRSEVLQIVADFFGFLWIFESVFSDFRTNR